MKRNMILSILTLLVAGCILSACVLVIPIPVMLNEAGVPQVSMPAPGTASSFEQVDFQTLPTYQAWLAGYQAAPAHVESTANRFDQIADCQCLAEYEAYIAGFQVTPTGR